MNVFVKMISSYYVRFRKLKADQTGCRFACSKIPLANYQKSTIILSTKLRTRKYKKKCIKLHMSNHFVKSHTYERVAWLVRGMEWKESV